VTPTKRTVLILLLALLSAAESRAFTPPLLEALNRDARKLLPRSLRRLLAERETKVLDEMRRFPVSVSQAVLADASAGRLSAETAAACQAEAQVVVDLIKKQQLSEGLARMGALMRIPADLSDPVLAVGSEGYPEGLTREYYAFVEGYLAKIPVVLDDPAALKLDRAALPGYWQSLLARSREQSPVLRTEMVQGGRVVSHRSLDYRSPVYAVASLSYSRAVNGIAATWLAVWREAHGDTTRIPKPREVIPQDGPPTLALFQLPEEP
jgi:ribosome modulation factor